jgi:hypothetical protein
MSRIAQHKTSTSSKAIATRCAPDTSDYDDFLRGTFAPFWRASEAGDSSVCIITALLVSVPGFHPALIAKLTNLRETGQAARSFTSAEPLAFAQWAQQKKCPPASMPCPIILQ